MVDNRGRPAALHTSSGPLLLQLLDPAPVRRYAARRDHAACRASVGRRPARPGARGRNGRQGLSAPRAHHDGCRQRRHARPLALPGGPAAQDRTPGDAVPDPRRGRPPGRCDRPALPGAGAAGGLRRPAHRGAGRPTARSCEPGTGHRRRRGDRRRGQGQALRRAAQDTGRPADDRPTASRRRRAGHAPGTTRLRRRPRFHLRQGRNPADLELPGEGVAPCGPRGWAGAAAPARPSAHSGGAVDRGRRQPQGGQRAGGPHVGSVHARPLRPPVRGARPGAARPAGHHAG